jgi:ergothioneine biosynthesis protein EgtB
MEPVIHPHIKNLKEWYIQVRNQTEKICAALHPEAYTVQAADFASPAKWHLGHTTWFFETFVLKKQVPSYTLFHPDFDFIFNSYYESLGKRIQRNNRGILFQPYVDEVYAYRAYVDEHIQKNYESFDEATLQILTLGLHHEQQHQELLITDLTFLFSQHPLLPAWEPASGLDHLQMTPAYNWLPVTKGVYSIGFQGTGFCFDNELPIHPQYIPSFEIMSQPVNNAEYLEFIEQGGYKNFTYWLAEGWDWVQKNQVEHPMYWHKNEQGEYMFYHINGLKKLDPLLPVMHINYYEADAFAQWKGLSLPTEFEWETAAYLYPHDFTNRVWEWTQSAYLPYPGFTIAPGAIGEYNGKFMVNQMVLRGGSFVSPQAHIRPSYRNFFHPVMQWQFSGMRLIKRTDKK